MFPVILSKLIFENFKIKTKYHFDILSKTMFLIHRTIYDVRDDAAHFRSKTAQNHCTDSAITIFEFMKFLL